jgi:hypothetical protein
MAAEQCYVGTI